MATKFKLGEILARVCLSSRTFASRMMRPTRSTSRERDEKFLTRTFQASFAN
jgi:hypothetical protein